MGSLAVVDLSLVTKHVNAKLTCDENGHTADPEMIGDPLKHGNDDDCADNTVKVPSEDITVESCKILVHRNVEYMSLVSITILNAAHGKKIGLMFDGRKKGELPVFGVNFTYNCEKNGVSVLSNLAVKTFHL